MSIGVEILFNERFVQEVVPNQTAPLGPGCSVPICCWCFKNMNLALENLSFIDSISPQDAMRVHVSISRTKHM